MKTHPILLFFILLAAFGAGCHKKESPAPKSIAQIRLNIAGEPATLDPRKGGDLISSELQILLFEGLTRLNHNGEVELAQAKSVDLSEDKMVYTFHLRGTEWSNGKPVTAYEFERAWKDILDPDFPAVNAHVLYPIKNAEAAKKGKVPLSEVGVEAIDADTLVVTLEKPTPYFLGLTSFCALSPVNREIDEDHPDWAYHAGKYFVSNGPYKLDKWRHNDELIVVKNPCYWQADVVPSESIHFSMINDEMTALQMFESGKLDMVGSPLCALPVEASLELHKQGKLLRKPIAATTLVTFNTDRFPFTNAHIRKAFSYAINREEIVEHITQLNEQVATNVIPPALNNYPTRALFKDHDLVKAQELLALGLAELGITKEALPEIVFHYITSEINHKIVQAIQQQWQKSLGIQIKLNGLEQKVLMSRLTKRDYTVAQCIWVAQYRDPMNIFERFKFKDNVKNYPAWENAEYIQLLNQSALETGEERVATLEKAEALLLEEMPLAPIYHWDYAFLVQPHLQEIAMSPTGDLYQMPSTK